jgi:hypothetical protein
MLIKDTDVLKRQGYFQKVERTRDIAFGAGKRETRNASLVENPKTSVANPEHQLGRKLTSTKFMQLLNTINKDLVLDPHPALLAPQDSAYYKLNFDKAVLNLSIGGKKMYLFVCEGDFMPEWDTMDTNTAKIPDGAPDGPWKDVRIPWHVVKRGWRTVLIRLIHKRIITVTDAERVFGIGKRESWKILTGKGFGELSY